MNNITVINFDIINNECRRDFMVKTEKECQTVTSKDLKSYPEKEKKR